MNTNKQYLYLSMATVFAVVALSVGELGFAQTVTPLSCSVSTTSVRPNQAAVFTAVGGNGTYAWSGTNLNVTNAAGTQFAVSYPNPGVYPITVTSAGLTATCNMTVVASATPVLTCSPGTQSVTLGQTATFAATGGNGSYVWSSPDLTITNATGSGFSASYAGTGVKTMTVTSNGYTDTCAVNVLPGTTNPNPTPTPTPGLPNTGGGYNK